MARIFDLPGRSPVYASNGMVATSHPMASSAALTVLREGGNAVDAAIAAGAVLSVVEPQMTGIGGDCFAILAQPDGSIHGLNASGNAATKANTAWFLENGINGISETSAHSVTVPGALRGWEMLHDKFGSMDWARLFVDAIDLANDGWAVAPRVAFDWAGLVKKLKANRGGAKHYLKKGKAPQPGDIWRSPELGGVLERIAREGVDAFYEGEVAKEIAGTVQALGGFLSEEDFANYSAEWVNLISTNYKGHDLLEIPPNGQGITALIMMNLLTECAGGHEAMSDARFHEALEIGRIAYSVRDAHVSDPSSMKASVERLLSSAYTKDLLKLFDPNKRNPNIELPNVPGSDTIYLSIVDRDQRAISFIYSIYSGFGSAIATDETGIILQNRGACFVVEEGHPNTIEGGKKPMHTIIPAMVMKDNKPTHSFGVMGGAYQPMGHAHVLANMLEYGMDPQEALDFPRAFWNEGGDIGLETGIPANVASGLEKRGHQISRGAFYGGGQIIRIDHQRGLFCGGSDPRKDGHAAGY